MAETQNNTVSTGDGHGDSRGFESLRVALRCPRARAVAIFVPACLIRAYQLTLSPIVGHHCRFSPTCSRYSLQALSERGLLTGLRLTFRRILRCHPFNRGGYDPVPPVKMPGR